MDTRDALLFADGSLSVFAAGWPMERITAERLDCDKNENRPGHQTKIVRVQYEVLEIVFDPTSIAAPPSELEALRAEVAALRSRLGETVA